MTRNFIQSVQRASGSLARDTTGTVAVIFALCLIPIAMAASVALDMSTASATKSEIQSAADTAVLAAATRLAVNASEADKEALALETFYANLSPALADHTGTPTVDIDFPAKQVRLAVDVETSTLVGNFASDGYTLHVEATATVSKGTPICMMTLNPHAQESLTLQGTADLVANDCAVHVNSDHGSDALHQQGSATGTAESFCVRGGHYGSAYTPTPKDGCMVENDPLAAGFAADWAAAGIDSKACTFSNLAQINTAANTVTNLAPGVYCGGLTIKKGIVQLESDKIYVFRDGPLHVQAHGTLKGTRTPILFHGDDTTRLITQAGAKIITSAPTSGQFKGIAFAQHPSSVPSSENLIIGGGQMEIAGIVYFPKQKLKITGNGDIGTTVSQFAIIADTVAIEGNGQLNIHIGQNYQDSGLPDLPEAHEIVHLIE
jgi:Flp pilus assembly protein TadG